MGFFSFRCAKSGISVANVFSGEPAWQSDCYLITPDEVFHQIAYEGYGVFGGKDVYELLGEGDRNIGIDNYYEGNSHFDIKIVLAKYYNGEKYEDIDTISTQCEYQGYFFDEEYDPKDQMEEFKDYPPIATKKGMSL